MSQHLSTTGHHIIRRIEWDSMHRIPGHEGKCAAFHGHRYAAEIAVSSAGLDQLGRVIDFSVVKAVIGGWVDKNWDHTAILHKSDPSPACAGISEANSQAGRPVYLLDVPPTVEYIVAELARVATDLLEPYEISLAWIRVWETPNCSAVWKAQS